MDMWSKYQVGHELLQSMQPGQYIARIPRIRTVKLGCTISVSLLTVGSWSATVYRLPSTLYQRIVPSVGTVSDLEKADSRGMQNPIPHPVMPS